MGGPTTISHTGEGTRQRPLSARDDDSTIASDHIAVNTVHQIVAGTVQEDSFFEKKKVHTVENALLRLVSFFVWKSCSVRPFPNGRLSGG